MSQDPDDRSRTTRVRGVVATLGNTRAGQEFGLNRVASLADLRATVPLLSQAEHAERIERELGFATGSFATPGADAPDAECEAAVQALSSHLRRRPDRIALVRALDEDPRVDALRVGDFKRLVGDGEWARFIHGNLDEIVGSLRAFEPALLVVPSLATVAWIESRFRKSLDAELPSVCAIAAEHDLGIRLRTRVPCVSASWIARAGRMGRTSAGDPRAIDLESSTVLLELLARPDVAIEARELRVDAILPEQAIVGEIYEVVVTSALGCLRLCTGEHVRVIGFSAPSDLAGVPIPRVLRVPPPPSAVALEGVTLAGSWLTASVRQAFHPEDPALICADVGPDPDAINRPGMATTQIRRDPFAETELAQSRLTPRSRRKSRGLVVRIETQGRGGPRLAGLISARVDADLRDRSQAYAFLRADGQLLAPRVVESRSGDALARREQRLIALRGPVEVGVVRVTS